MHSARVYCCMHSPLSCYDKDAFSGHDIHDEVVNHLALTIKLILYNNLKESKDSRCAL